MALKDYIKEKPTIETKRLTLRPMTAPDVPSLEEWMPDKSIYAYWGKPPGKTDKNPSLMFSKADGSTKSFHLGIALNEDRKVIGEIWIYLIENDRMAKLAVRVGRSFQGKGYGSEAVRAMIDFCFRETELQRIWTDVHTDNSPSCKMLEKCGFTREGTIRQGKMVSMWCDYHLYGLLKSDVVRHQSQP